MEASNCVQLEHTNEMNTQVCLPPLHFQNESEHRQAGSRRQKRRNRSTPLSSMCCPLNILKVGLDQDWSHVTLKPGHLHLTVARKTAIPKQREESDTAELIPIRLSFKKIKSIIRWKCFITPFRIPFPFLDSNCCSR